MLQFLTECRHIFAEFEGDRLDLHPWQCIYQPRDGRECQIYAQLILLQAFDTLSNHSSCSFRYTDLHFLEILCRNQGQSSETHLIQNSDLVLLIVRDDDRKEF